MANLERIGLQPEHEELLKSLRMKAYELSVSASGGVNSAEPRMLHYREAMRNAQVHFMQAWTELVNAFDFYVVD